MPYVSAMSVEERETFLGEARVGILAVDEPGRGPLAVPIWYRYLDGVIELGIDGRSLKARLLRSAGRATLTVQDEQPPYRYVSVEGPIEFVDRVRDVPEVAARYLGVELGDWYAARNPATPNTVVVVLTPAHWRTQDFGAGVRRAEAGSTGP
jgi:hypothetical protein